MAEKRTQARDTEDKSVDVAADEVQDAVDTETEQGYRGVKVDTTPDHAYTIQGVLAGEPVPEAAADPVQARRDATAG